MGIHRHSYRPEGSQHGPERNFGHSTSHTTGPFLYTTPGGETWKVYSVAFTNEVLRRCDDGKKISPTHRAFVAPNGRQVFVPFTDIVSRGSTARTLFEQLAVAVPRDQLSV